MSGDMRDLTIKSVAELLELFASISREIETVSHIHRANRLHETRRRVVAAIKDRTDGSVRALLPLVSHDDPHVRESAAYFHDKFSHLTPASAAQNHPLPPAPSPRDSRLSGHDAPGGMSRLELEPLLFDAFPRETASTLMRLARPAIRVWPQPLARASDKSSRFGGMPIVPKNWQWPATEVWPKSAGLDLLMNSQKERGPMPQEPRWFLGQINCADLRGLHSAEGLIPPVGVSRSMATAIS